MYIIRNDNWGKHHTPISKYFFERLFQRLDAEEVISNKHRTTNGFVLIDEIVNVCNSSLKRAKNTSRVKSLIEESVSKQLGTNISNDPIIKKNFHYIIQYLHDKQKQNSEDNKQYVNEIYLRSQSFVKALEKKYYKYLKEELKKVDIKSKSFNQETAQLDKLIDCLIPFLLHKGYTISKIRKYGKFFISSPSEDPLNSFIRLFNFTPTPFVFWLLLDKKTEINIFCNAISSQKIEYQKLNKRNVKIENFTMDPGETFTKKEISNSNIYKFQVKGIDEYAVIREIFATSLKNHIIKKNRPSLVHFNDFFDRIYYENIEKPGEFKKPTFPLDPINVKERPNTLLKTLKLFEDIEELPIIEELAQPIYYYNLALGSKSIENSLLLIWSALEALIPYNYKNNDIGNIQFFVSKFLSTGSIGRELYSFIKRFQYYEDSHDSLKALGTQPFGNGVTSVSLHNWFIWLTQKFEEKYDPYNILKPSPLLCKQFIKFNEVWGEKEQKDDQGKTFLKYGTLEVFYERIEASKNSIHYQLDRIYLHRNKIAHSAIFLNEYSNMWSHLEWYVGKILAYCVKNYFELLNKGKEFHIKDAFLSLESECDEIESFISENKKMRIIDLEKERFLELFSQNWQYF